MIKICTEKFALDHENNVYLFKCKCTNYIILNSDYHVISTFISVEKKE